MTLAKLTGGPLAGCSIDKDSDDIKSFYIPDAVSLDYEWCDILGTYHYIAPGHPVPGVEFSKVPNHGRAPQCAPGYDLQA